jgi:hypothetical protein
MKGSSTVLAPERAPAALVALLTFAIAGPPIGGVLMAVAVATIAPLAAPDAGIGLGDIWWLAGLAVPYSYLAGGLQALGVGLACAAWILLRGGLPFAVPLAAALIAGAMHVARSAEDPTVSVLLLAAHVMAAATCWSIARRLLPRAGT